MVKHEPELAREFNNKTYKCWTREFFYITFIHNALKHAIKKNIMSEEKICGIIGVKEFNRMTEQVIDEKRRKNMIQKRIQDILIDEAIKLFIDETRDELNKSRTLLYRCTHAIKLAIATMESKYEMNIKLTHKYL